jgi:hypothetical protein
MLVASVHIFAEQQSLNPIRRFEGEAGLWCFKSALNGMSLSGLRVSTIYHAHVQISRTPHYYSL